MKLSDTKILLILLLTFAITVVYGFTCNGIDSSSETACSGHVAKNTLLQSTNEVYREMPENDYLVSSDGTFKLVIENKSLRLYSGPNLIKILYNPDRPLEDYGRMWLIMLNYALALFANSGGTVWTQYVISIGFKPYSLVLQNDGNLVVYYQSGIAWTSETAIPGKRNDYLYTGSYCQEPRCFGYNSTDINNVCSGKENYGGSMCEYHKCFGKLSTDKSVCSGHGFCIGVDNCACVDYRTTAKNTLASSSILFLNEYIMSSNGRFKLILESGGLRIYDNSTVKRVITTFNPTYTTIKLQMQANGNLVLSISGTTLWETMTANGGIPPYNLVMQSDGNLILYHAGGYLTNWNTAVAGLTSDYFYGGNNCQEPRCFGLSPSHSNVCSGKGPNSCECQSGWKGATDCSKQSCELLDNCSNHGICVDPNRCDCQSGWKGSNNCSMFTCDGLNNCNNRGSCIGPNQCSCLENNYGSQCDVEITLQYPSIVSLSTNITFTPNITSILSNPSMTFKWSQISGPNTLDLDNISTTGTDKKELTIKANTDTFNNGLIEGATYHLKLHITVKELNGSFNIEKVVIFTPNRSPIINSFSIVDSLTNQETTFGLVDQTNFKLTILNASDSENQDLQYSFGYFNQLGEKIIISPFSSNNYTFFKVPILGTVRLFFAVRDSMLSVTQKEFSIMLIDPIDSSNEKQLIDYVSSLVNSTSVDYNNLQVLEVATVLLDKTLNSNTSREAERIELKSKIINNLSNYIINNNQSDVSSVVNILNLLSNQTKEITVPTSIKSLTILKTLINNNHNRNEISEKREDILKITSQLITSTFSSQQQTNTSDIVKNILDGISKFTAINLNNGEFIISNYNNINSLFIKGRIEEIVNILTTSLNSSLTSIIGLTSINIPIDSIQQIIGLNTVVLSIQKVNPIIYSFSERILTSSILRISLFSQNGNVIEINQLTKPIEFELKMTTTTVPTGMIRKCLYFNEKLKQFSDEGVETVNVTGEEKLKCKVYHLTDFTTGMQVLQPRSSISKVMISTGSINGVNNLWLYLVLMISFYIAIK
ncbi:hypothetical protein ABK040_001193 [Willaertia magna]